MATFINGVPQFNVVTHHMDFWSINDACVTIDATISDIALPDVVVADVPTGATVTRALGMMKYAKAVNTSACANKIIGAGVSLQMRVAAGTFINAHLIPACSICLAACGRESGDLMMGSIDVTEEFGTPNSTYNFQLNCADACKASITLKCLQTGVRVYFV